MEETPPLSDWVALRWDWSGMLKWGEEVLFVIILWWFFLCRFQPTTFNVCTMPSQCRLSMHDWWHMGALKLLITQRMLTVNTLLLALFFSWACRTQMALRRYAAIEFEVEVPTLWRFKYCSWTDCNMIIIITQALKFGTGSYYYYWLSSMYNEQQP